MTAIIVGRLKKANFIVVDAMVQTKLEISDYKECRLQDKISDIDLTQQYLVLAGEEIIAQGTSVLNYWSVIKKIRFDLFNTSTFGNILKLADRFREIHKKLDHPIIEQERSNVYVAGRGGIKYYEIKHNGTNYVIKAERFFLEGEVVLNYKGNISNLTPPPDEDDILKFGMRELEKEHLRRKLSGYKIGQLPLKYDFQNIFSSVIIPVDPEVPINRKYPFNEVTDMFLSTLADWDLITNPPFRFTINP